MTNKMESSQSKYLITASLLNSWLYIWESARNTVEAESDTICLEDKKSDKQKQAEIDFTNTLLRVKTPPNKYMQEGIDFEKECYAGNTCISPIIENGCFQISNAKEFEVDGMRFVLYGILDVLKGGAIYDIKRIWKYSINKYSFSAQHHCYFVLFPNAYKFTYLAYDGHKLHKETYYRENEEEWLKNLVKDFIKWLKEKGLFNTYLENWKSKY